ncbi:MAG: hypothetical protein B7Y80_14765 [Hyphomicrobium sp. 32-62-53]|nr:MAG: hypothetical protein B7Z29_15700 [Hyphomicrobium sp. 12-62-95]OYX98592.1 MAG: hypothetical protein B7Y80_14765 [Hyphomicrobium sp. 32-62-53]
MVIGRAIILVLCGGFAGLGGCAGSGAGAGGEGLLPQGYTMSAEEKALDCRRLTGRIQVRLLALRGEAYKVQPSAAAQSMRSATSAALGTDTAKNAAVRAAAERPVLEAYNARLVELSCPSFDLGKELEARPSAPTPYPTIPARKAS